MNFAFTLLLVFVSSGAAFAQTEVPCDSSVKVAVAVELIRSGINPEAVVIDQPVVVGVDATRLRIQYEVRVNYPRTLIGYTHYKQYRVDLSAVNCGDAEVTLQDEVQ